MLEINKGLAIERVVGEARRHQEIRLKEEVELKYIQEE
jgi:hypothetical protein